METKSCCFIGNRFIENHEQVEEKLNEIVKNLVENGTTVFYFGNKCEFETLAWKVVTRYKEENKDIRRILLRSYPVITQIIKEYLLEYYDDTYIPDGVPDEGLLTHFKHFFRMIDLSSICVFYYNENFALPWETDSEQTTGKRRHKNETEPRYRYAVEQNKPIINIFDLI